MQPLVSSSAFDFAIFGFVAACTAVSLVVIVVSALWDRRP